MTQHVKHQFIQWLNSPSHAANAHLSIKQLAVLSGSVQPKLNTQNHSFLLYLIKTCSCGETG